MTCVFYGEVHHETAWILLRPNGVRHAVITQHDTKLFALYPANVWLHPLRN